MFLPGHIHLAPTQRVHFIGIGGIGMSGIAEILLTMGYAVSGSDLRSSPATERLATLGATIYEGHAAANAAACDVVVASSAVSAANPEIVQARLRKVPVIQRAEMLAELMRLKYGIAVAGMHGKTTTTSMIAAVLSGGGLDPTVVVGGRVDALGSNARLGTSQYLVAEADESDRSFLKLSPILAVITNLDREHMDTYSSLEDIENSFVEFMDRLPFYGAATACLDNDLLRAILPRVRRKVYTYGERPDADFRLHLLPPEPGAHSTFQISLNGILIGPFNLHVPGKHNVLNATAAICVGIQLGVTPAAIAKGLATFRGVDRRFQLKGTVAGIAVVDDYGHHPTEILATLRAARDCHYARIHVVFQPHRYTRTRDLLHEFAAAFTDADTVEILDIYAASEEPIPNITGEALAREIATLEPGKSIEYSPTVAHAIEELVQAAQPGDVVMTLGAGSVSHIAPLLLEALRVAHPGAETSN
jgi:UDP-N-acetylmuramate--alanine ligase